GNVPYRPDQSLLTEISCRDQFDKDRTTCWPNSCAPSLEFGVASKTCLQILSNYFGITGSTSADGCCVSCKMLFVAETKCLANLISSPVPRLRSNRGKLPLAISRRSECPRRNTLLVPHRSIEIW